MQESMQIMCDDICAFLGIYQNNKDHICEEFTWFDTYLEYELHILILQTNKMAVAKKRDVQWWRGIAFNYIYSLLYTKEIKLDLNYPLMSLKFLM